MSEAAVHHPEKPSRRPFFVVLALFFAPLAAAFLVYYGMAWRPAGNTSHGDLITPARPLPEAALPTPQGGSTAPGFLRDKWSLVYIADGECAADCREALVRMRQIRLALNKDMGRVQRIFLYGHACCDLSYFGSEHSGLILAKLAGEPGAALSAVFPSYDGVPAGSAGRIYIVDPLGNLMMSYAPESQARGILTDLKKLLKLSHIG